ncbi:hypothetical protein DSO57_1022011 [Entomophthora muscae]|uniref:Uncharacterized protein n=1 Tax=Entomophthora muscae TaxID=34485 RepID=A0ACC2TE14_9FUNG|nr:hypothetical protein DSO57_1022011 [Entomophthora muscae]
MPGLHSSQSGGSPEIDVKLSSSPDLVVVLFNLTSIPPWSLPVLDALGQLQLRLLADSPSLDTSISEAQRSVALLDALNGEARLWVHTLLHQSQELGDTSSLLTLVSSAVAALGSRASVIFETLHSKGLTPDLASHVECFAVKAASLDLPTEMAVAMFQNSLLAASANKSVWDLAPNFLKKAFVLA